MMLSCSVLFLFLDDVLQFGLLQGMLSIINPVLLRSCLAVCVFAGHACYVAHGWISMPTVAVPEHF
jgi:hypothetical protein